MPAPELGRENIRTSALSATGEYATNLAVSAVMVLIYTADFVYRHTNTAHYHDSVSHPQPSPSPDPYNMDPVVEHETPQEIATFVKDIAIEKIRRSGQAVVNFWGGLRSIY